MIESEALAEVALLAAFYPGTSAETIAAVAAEVLRFEHVDLQVARHSVAEAWKRDRMPPPGVIIEHIKAARTDRVRDERPALPGTDPEAYLGQEETDLRRVRLVVGLNQGLRGEALLDFTTSPQECDNMPPPTRDELSRALAAEIVAADPTEPRPGPDHSGCKGNALPPAWVQGQPRCQVCGAQVAQVPG